MSLACVQIQFKRILFSKAFRIPWADSLGRQSRILDLLLICIHLPISHSPLVIFPWYHTISLILIFIYPKAYIICLFCHPECLPNSFCSVTDMLLFLFKVSQLLVTLAKINAAPLQGVRTCSTLRNWSICYRNFSLGWPSLWLKQGHDKATFLVL